MCVALPAKVLQRLDESRAVVQQGERTFEISVQLVPDVKVGQFVLLNLGMAVEKLTEEEANEVFKLWDDIALSMSDAQ